MKKVANVIGGGAVLAVIAVTQVGCAQGRGAASLTDCGTNCRITVTVPSDSVSPPQIPVEQQIIRARAGSTVTLEIQGKPSGARPALVFDTPVFVNDQGELLWVVVMTSSRESLVVRSDPGTACTTAPGCKYTIIDLGRGQRETLDPYIIIDR
jgi:hypothetical protein